MSDSHQIEKQGDAEGRRRLTFAVGAALLAIAVIFFFAASGTQSPWHIALDLKNWRVFVSQGVTFDPDGARLKTTKKHHYGPITIASERRWTSETTPALSTNAPMQSQ
jgi:hypothetical protein